MSIYAGFNCLFLERMDLPLENIVPLLVKRPKIDLGPVALQLLNILQAVHAQCHFLTDVKLENFMLARASKVSSTLEARIRVIDLAMAEPSKMVGGKLQNVTKPEMAGTPLYASLHVHALQTHSFRDDVESVLYVLAELVIRTQATQEGTLRRYEATRGTDVLTFLPWSHGASTEQIGELKKRLVTDPKSEFYQRMPPSIAKSIRDALHIVWECEFNEHPDWSALEHVLHKLVFPKTVPKSQAAGTAKAPPVSKSKNSLKVSHRDQLEDARRRAREYMGAPEIQSQASKVVSRTSERAQRAAKRSSLESRASPKHRPPSSRYFLDSNRDEGSPGRLSPAEPAVDVDGDVSMDDAKDYESDDETFYTTHDPLNSSLGSPAMMSVASVQEETMELASDENQKPGLLTVWLKVTAGPSRGRKICLTEGSSEVITIGSKPNTKGESFRLGPDVEANHARFTLQVQRSKRAGVSFKVQVDDLKTSSGVTILEHRISKGKSGWVFANQSVRLGKETVLRVCRAV
jgi:serine/threonine protein kinase